MSPSVWRRYLPDWGQIWIPALIIVLIFAGVSFMNLASARSEAQREEQTAKERVQRLRDQNERLLAAQAHAESGDNVDQLARDEFGYAYPGEARIIGEQAAVPAQPGAAAPPPSGPPYWLEWRKYLLGF